MGVKILITGGTGYIGSHTVVQLIEAGFPVVIFDNLSNSSRSVLDRIVKLKQSISSSLKVIFEIESPFETRSKIIQSVRLSIIAGLKAVGESEAQPLKYYDNNVSGSVVLFEEMAQAGVQTVKLFTKTICASRKTSATERPVARSVNLRSLCINQK